MLAFLGNLSPLEIIVILALAVLIFGKDLPHAASKAYLQVRKLRNAVDDLRRDSGIERELREIERNVREAEWEARRMEVKGALPRAAPPPIAPPASAAGAPPASPSAATATAEPATPSEPPATPLEPPEKASEPSAPTGPAS